MCATSGSWEPPTLVSGSTRPPHDLLLTSKDTDFYQRSLLFGAPPRIIWLRVGNVSTGAIAELLRRQYLMIRRFADDPAATVLVIPPPEK